MEAVEAYIKTFCTRVYLNDEEHEILLQQGMSLSKARHTLFKMWKIQGIDLAECKRQICSPKSIKNPTGEPLSSRFATAHGLSSRQFNSIRFDIDQACATWSGTLKYRISDIEYRITDLEKSLLKQTHKIKKTQKDITSHKTFRKNLSQVLFEQKNNLNPALKKSAAKLKHVGMFKELKTPLALSKKIDTLEISLRFLKKKKSRIESKLKKQKALLEKLKIELDGKPKVCFGGKQLLASANQQISALKNEKVNVEAASSIPLNSLPLGSLPLTNLSPLGSLPLMSQWKTKRSSMITCVGSKDETAGCQSAVFDPLSNTLKISLLPTQNFSDLKSNLKSDLKSLLTSPIRLPKFTLQLEPNAFNRNNGRALIAAAITRKKVTKTHKTTHKTYESMECASALTWKLWAEPEHDLLLSKDTLRKGLTPNLKTHAWAVRVSLKVPVQSIQTHHLVGAIGIDVNADHLACTRVDRFGNLVEVKRFDFPHSKSGYSTNQSRALIEETAKSLCEWAKIHSTPIIIEDLDFQKKKAGLKALGSQFAHLLSGFAYNKFKEALLSRAHKIGIEVKSVNPAYTSKIAAVKYQSVFPQHSVHTLASYVIARRGLGLLIKEKTNFTNTKTPLRGRLTPKIPFAEKLLTHVSIKDPARSLSRDNWVRWKSSMFVSRLKKSSKISVSELKETSTVREKKSYSSLIRSDSDPTGRKVSSPG